MNGYIATNGPLPSTNGHGTIVANGGATLMLTTPAMASGSACLGQMTYYNPRHHNGQPMPPQVSVVIGTGPHSTTYPPNKCCLACCLAPLWYGQCNIYRVIALICNLFVDLLMILCLLSTNWLTTTKYRQGLWQYCIEVDSPRPLPFGLNDEDGCHWGRDVAYIRLSGFFAAACFVLSIIATILTSFGLSSRDPNRKYTFYRFALYIDLAALLAIIVSLTLYPAFFYTELHHTNAVPANRPHWYFGWAYGVGWGSAIFLIGAILLLVCDKETEEIYYKERTIVHANNHLHHHSQQHHQLLRPSPQTQQSGNFANHNSMHSVKA